MFFGHGFSNTPLLQHSNTSAKSIENKSPPHGYQCTGNVLNRIKSCGGAGPLKKKGEVITHGKNKKGSLSHMIAAFFLFKTVS